jgi:hypothetical protein
MGRTFDVHSHEPCTERLFTLLTQPVQTVSLLHRIRVRWTSMHIYYLA